MRRLLKFIHTIGAIGMMGAIACMLVLLHYMPAPSALAEYAQMRGAMASISKWVFLPSLTLTLIGGLLAIAVTRAYQDVGWVWVKLATGILVFEAGLTGIDGPMAQEATLAAKALAGTADVTKLGAHSEWVTLWVMMAISAVNVALGVWRPRFRRSRAQTPANG